MDVRWGPEGSGEAGARGAAQRVVTTFGQSSVLETLAKIRMFAGIKF